LVKKFIQAKVLTEESRANALSELATCEKLDIVSLPHTHYIAKALQKHLNDIGIKSEILESVPLARRKETFIVICPQVVDFLPEKYIAFQMEQTVSSRWLTEEYYEILNNAVAVFDYSKRNIEFFKNTPFASRMYYVPIDYCNLGYEQGDTIYDVLFYGDTRCERRQKYLNELQKHFNVKILFKVYHDAALEKIRQAKIVVNIHYYEDALLETTRISEVLSLNSSIIVSERGIDNDEYELDEIVDFVDIGNIDSMVSCIHYWLGNEDAREEKLHKNKIILDSRQNSMALGLRRFFLDNGKALDI